MKNIRFLSRRVDIKNSTEYAVFFEHGDIRARLDWELVDLDGVNPNHVGDLMLLQIETDLNDPETVEEIRADNSRSPYTHDQIVERWVQRGFVEHDAEAFKTKAYAQFGAE